MPTSNSSTSVTGHKRRPKAERKPPAYSFTIPRMDFEEALLSITIDNKHMEKESYGYNQTADWDYRFTPMHVIEENLAFFVTERSVTMIESRRVVRWNMEASKAYVKNETTAVRTIFLTSRDNVHFYFYDISIDAHGKKRRIMHRPFDLEAGILTGLEYQFAVKWTVVMNKGMQPITMLRALAEKQFGKPVDLDHVYPMREYLGPAGNMALPGTLMRCSNPQEFTREAFGKKLYRKDLVKALSRTVLRKQFYYPGDDTRRIQKLLWLMEFKNLVPIDWIIKATEYREAFLQSAEADPVVRVNDIMNKFRTILEHLKPAERRNILDHGANMQEIVDTVRTWFHTDANGYLGPQLIDSRERNFTSFADLHNYLFQQYRQYNIEIRKRENAERYKPEKMWVNQDDSAAQLGWALEHLISGPVEFVVARDYDTISDWSDYMNNCISSYFGSNDTILVGIYQDGKLLANAEIHQYMTERGRYPENSDFKLKQLLGKHNARLDTELRGTIEAYFKQFGITVDTGVWW